jgi:hypothetical protein
MRLLGNRWRSTVDDGSMTCSGVLFEDGMRPMIAATPTAEKTMTATDAVAMGVSAYAVLIP